MTPCEIWVEFDAAQARWREQFERQLSVEWFGLRMYFEAMTKQYLQPLKSYLDENKPKMARPTLQQQKIDLLVLSQSYGIPMLPAPVRKLHG